MKENRIPEKTPYGVSVLYNIADIKKKYLSYIIGTKGKYDFSYEFNYDKANVPVFITGREDEKELPLVKFPLVVNTNGVNYIVTNIIGSVKTDVSTSILEARKTDYVDFEVMRSLVIYHVLANKDTDYLATLVSQIATLTLTKMITNKLRLSTFDAIDLEGALFVYFLRMFGEFNRDSIESKLLNLSSISYRNNIGAVSKLLDKLDKVEDNYLDKYIQAVSDSPLLQKLEYKAILATLNGLWFTGGEDSIKHLYLALEDLSTMTAVLYHAANTATGKKTLLGRLINDNKRSLKLDQFNSMTKSYITDYTIA